MFNLARYPKQYASRKGYALMGGLLLVFGAITAFFGDMLMATTGLLIGLALLLPACWLGQLAFVRYEKWLSRLAIWGNL